MKKITLKEVRAWERRAYDLFYNLDELTAEEARDLEYEIYSDEISYDYGNYALYVEPEAMKMLKETYTKKALEEVIEYYDTCLVYGAMRRYLCQFYEIDERNCDFFDVNC